MDITWLILLKAEAVQVTLLFVLIQVSSTKQQQHLKAMFNEKTFNMNLHPMSLDEVLEDTSLKATFNCTHTDFVNGLSKPLYLVVTTKQRRVVVPFNVPEPSLLSNKTTIIENEDGLAFPIDCAKNPHSFGIHTNTVGRSTLVVRISTSPSLTTSSAIYTTQIDVSVVRKVRMPDLAFDCVIPVIMLLISFSVGCVTDSHELQTFRSYPMPILLGIICQVIFMPLLSLCIAKVAFREPDMGLGLLLVATVPGGGSGHLMVAIVEANIPLSYVLNFTAYILPTVTAPLWILAMGRFVMSTSTTIPYGKLMLWLGCSLACYLLGLALRRKSECLAEGILNWLTKPFLLFASILFVSLGLYINFFMFMVLDVSSLLAIALYPCLAYCLGYFLPYAIRQQLDYTKTIATESAMPNCIVALVIVQYILPQPASDIATIAPIFVLIFSPIPFILEYLYKRLKVIVREKCAKRREIKEQNFSIVASTSLLNITHMTQLESSSFVSQRNDASNMDIRDISPYRKPSTSDNKITTL